MRRSELLRVFGLVFALLPGWLPVAHADIELTDPTGRRILLKDDGTWRVLQAKEPGAPASAAEAGKADKADNAPEFADLRLLRQIELPGSCRFEFELANTLPYEIRSVVPYIAVHRANGVVYATESVAFGPVKPGDKIKRSLSVAGIACSDIARLRVQGGDRCEMGDLHRFSDAKGQCLERLRLQPSDLVKFEK
jgi:hypothetical protein